MPFCTTSTCRRIRFLHFFLALVAGLWAVPRLEAQVVTVRAIEITGIKKTKAFIVRRELTFREGDTLSQIDLGQILERNRNNLINLGLFNQVVVNVSEWDTRVHEIDVTIRVHEAWYIYAAPIFDLADRNFNVWWNTYNGSLDRVNLGGRLDWLNFTGRNDKLKAKLQVGYTPKQEIEYRFPFLDRRQRVGVTASFLHSSNRETSYGTVNNREQFIQIDERRLHERYRSQATVTYRPSILLRHELTVGYQYVKADSQLIADYNPILFKKGKLTHRALTLRYKYEYDNRDIKIFPEKGFRVSVETEKTGFGQQADENVLKSYAHLEWNEPIGRRLQHRAQVSGQYSWNRLRPSYMHYQALGYGQNVIRGYELYLIDGLDFWIGKYQLSYKAVETRIHLGNWIPLPAFRVMPVRVYLSLYAETGYVNDPYTGSVNPLANRWLTGGGPGLDILLYNNTLMQINYGINHRGEKGIYINNRTSF